MQFLCTIPTNAVAAMLYGSKNYSMTLAEFVKSDRDGRGMGQEAYAAFLEVKINVVRNLEQGRTQRVSNKSLKAIADKTGKSLADLKAMLPESREFKGVTDDFEDELLAQFPAVTSSRRTIIIAGLLTLAVAEEHHERVLRMAESVRLKALTFEDAVSDVETILRGGEIKPPN